MTCLNLLYKNATQCYRCCCVNSDNMFVALVLGVAVHLVVSCGATNIPLRRASEGNY